MSGSWRIVNIETSICQLLRSFLKSNKSDITNVSSYLTSLFLSFVCFIHSPRIGFCALVNLKAWINRSRSEAQLAACTVRFFFTWFLCPSVTSKSPVWPQPRTGKHDFNDRRFIGASTTFLVQSVQSSCSRTSIKSFRIACSITLKDPWAF